MGDKDHKKPVITELAGLEQDLNRVVVETALKDKQRQKVLLHKLGWTLALVTGFSVLILSSNWQDLLNAQTNSRTTVHKQTSTDELPDPIKMPAYQVASGKAEFRWDYEGYELLEVGDQSQATGTRLTKIIDEYGLADQAYYFENDWQREPLLYLDYQQYQPRQSVHLIFYKNGDDYFLFEKSAQGLVPQALKAQLETHEDLDMMAYQPDKILVGISTTGQGGSSLEEVLIALGKPDDYSLSHIGQDAYGISQKDQTLQLMYGRATKVFYRLTLKNNFDGIYRVTSFIDED